MAGQSTNGKGVAAHLDLSSSRVDGWTVAIVAGQIDLATASQLRGYVNDLLADHGKPTQVIVDLTDVSFCDAYGLGMLNAVHRKAQQKGHTVRFVVSPGRVERLFRIMGGTHGLTPSVHNTLAEAIAPGG